MVNGFVVFFAANLLIDVNTFADLFLTL